LKIHIHLLYPKLPNAPQFAAGMEAEAPKGPCLNENGRCRKGTRLDDIPRGLPPGNSAATPVFLTINQPVWQARAKDCNLKPHYFLIYCFQGLLLNNFPNAS